MANDYNKRPVWQWVVIYLIIAVIVYGGIYFYLKMRNGYNSGGNTNTPSTGY